MKCHYQSTAFLRPQSNQKANNLRLEWQRQGDMEDVRKTKPSVNFSDRDVGVHVKPMTHTENHCDQQLEEPRGISKRSGLELISQWVRAAADSPVSRLWWQGRSGKRRRRWSHRSQKLIKNRVIVQSLYCLGELRRAVVQNKALTMRFIHPPVMIHF